MIDRDFREKHVSPSDLFYLGPRVGIGQSRLARGEGNCYSRLHYLTMETRTFSGNPLLWFFLSLLFGGGAFVYHQNNLAQEKARQQKIAQKIQNDKRKLREQLLSIAPTKEEMEQLFQQIYDSDADIRWESSLRIINKGGPQSMALLFSLLNQDPDSSIRRKALSKLLAGNRNSRLVLDSIGVAILDSDPDIRIKAIQAVAEIGNETYLDRLIQPLGDTNPKLRKATLVALSSIMKRTGRNVLNKDIYDIAASYLYDENDNVRWEAWVLLDAGRMPDSMKTLALLLDLDTSALVRERALDQFTKRLRGRERVEFLFKTLTHSDYEIVTKTFNAIGQFGAPGDIERLNRWTRFGKKEIRLAALAAVDQIEKRERLERYQIAEQIKAKEAELKKKQEGR